MSPNRASHQDAGSRAERTRAAQRAAEIRRAQTRKEQRRRNGIVTAVALVVIAVIVAVGYAVQSGRDTTGAQADAPAGATTGYGVPFGHSNAPVTVTVYEDFMCPICGELEHANREWLAQRVKSGDVRVVYQPVAYLNRFSGGTEYSTRAANAYAAVLDLAGPDAAARFHDLLFEHQPEEGSDGLTDDRLMELAVQAGAPEAEVRTAIDDRAFEPWVDNATDQASKDNVTGTPTVAVNGERLEQLPIDELTQVLRATVEQQVRQAG